MARCPKGTRRNKKTGLCEETKQTKTTDKKICPKGSRRNKKTGLCETKNNKRKNTLEMIEITSIEYQYLDLEKVDDDEYGSLVISNVVLKKNDNTKVEVDFTTNEIYINNETINLNTHFFENNKIYGDIHKIKFLGYTNYNTTLQNLKLGQYGRFHKTNIKNADKLTDKDMETLMKCVLDDLKK